MAKQELIELRDGSVYISRVSLETASEDPLTDREIVINDLHEQIKSLKKCKKCTK